jgi:hypothetical protein
LLSDDQRKLLAVKGKAIGRKALKEVSLIVTPDTILRVAPGVGSPEMGLLEAAHEQARAALGLC